MLKRYQWGVLRSFVKVYLLTLVVILLLLLGFSWWIGVELAELAEAVRTAQVPATFIVTVLLFAATLAWWTIRIDADAPETVGVGCLLIFAMLPAGAILGWVSSAAYHFLPQGNWEQLAPPPQPLTYLYFQAKDDERMFVAAKDAQGVSYLYGCVADQCDWYTASPANADFTPHYQIDRECPTVNEHIMPILRPWPPGRVYHQVQGSSCLPYFDLVSYFILLENNTVWQWSTYVNDDFITFSNIAFAILGALVAVTLLFLLWLYERLANLLANIF